LEAERNEHIDSIIDFLDEVEKRAEERQQERIAYQANIEQTTAEREQITVRFGLKKR